MQNITVAIDVAAILAILERSPMANITLVSVTALLVVGAIVYAVVRNGGADRR